MVTRVHIQGYRSVIDLEMELKEVNLITGANGVGKSNLLKALLLIQAAAEGRLGRAIRDEGGVRNLMHANEAPKSGSKVELSISLDEFEYTIVFATRPLSDLGNKDYNPYQEEFLGDPQIKSEKLKIGRSMMVDRGRNVVKLRDDEGKWQVLAQYISDSESVMSQLVDPRQYGYLFAFRERVRKWRLYHEFRCDADAPARVDKEITKTRSLPTDGADLDSALLTILDMGKAAELQKAVAEGFGGARVGFGDGVGVEFPGMARMMRLRELSDGTLRFLCLAAALLAPDAAEVMAFNEPESSLNERMIPALAKLIAEASKESQIWITTHSALLADLVAREVGVKRIALEMSGGRTTFEGWGETTVWRYED